jgi:hypothetical protein
MRADANEPMVGGQGFEWLWLLSTRTQPKASHSLADPNASGIVPLFTSRFLG